MFAVNHAATALLLKRRYPGVAMAPLLISVQAMELAWVGLHYLGVERSNTEPVVRSVADIHLSHMPLSHSVATAVAAAVLAWVALAKGFRKPVLARAVGLGVVSHLLLDLITHAPDIVLWPGLVDPRLGLGLYGAAPVGAFAVELLYGLFCWRVYRGGRALLAVVVIGNLANLSFLSPRIPGPEGALAGRPLLLVTLVLAQIVATLVLVGWLARRPPRTPHSRLAPKWSRHYPSARSCGPCSRANDSHPGRGCPADDRHPRCPTGCGDGQLAFDGRVGRPVQTPNPPGGSMIPRSLRFKAVSCTLTVLTALMVAGCESSTLAEPDGGPSFARSGTGNAEPAELLRPLRQATAKYHSTVHALRDGYLPDEHCVAVPGLGGMGHHWVNPSLVDDNFDLLHPEAVLYAPGSDGSLKLVAVEYIVLDTGQERPAFGEHLFDIGGTPVPVPHWSLHVWLHRENPNGIFTPFNPEVTCP